MLIRRNKLIHRHVPHAIVSWPGATKYTVAMTRVMDQPWAIIRKALA